LTTTVYDTILELLLQKYFRIEKEDKKESERISHQILTLLKDSKVKYFPECFLMSNGEVFLGWY
jgi:hypothetical protein